MTTQSNEIDKGLAKTRLRSWIRILRTTRLIEHNLRDNLRREFSSNLPKFDVMAALYQNRDRSMTMTELSKYLLVTNGNVTGLADRMMDEGLVIRERSTSDRRTIYIHLTALGCRRFEAMAAQHERWIDGMFGDLADQEIEQLTELMERIGRSTGEELGEI